MSASSGVLLVALVAFARPAAAAFPGQNGIVKTVTQAQAAEWIDDANRIRAVLGC